MLTALTLLALAVQAVAFGQNQPAAATPRPKISLVSPSKVSPAVRVSIEGQWLNLDDKLDGMVCFVQGAAEHRVEVMSWGAVDADPDGLQYTDVAVPEGLTPGPCEVVFEVGGRRSEPYLIEVVAAVTPPTLTEVRPRWARPGEGVLVMGTGFGVPDVVEVTDASGRVREIRASMNAEFASLNLPADMPQGRASLRVVERRSEENRRSNSVGFVVSRGPLPLHLVPEQLRPAAPGQSLYLAAVTWKPLEGATRLEVTLRRGGSSHTTVLTNLKDLRVPLPRAMRPGEVEILNRTWRGRVPSEWSEPVSYQISERPAAALVYNIQVWPRDSEVAFIQAGEEVAVLPAILEGRPRVKVPPDLKPGAVVIERRTRGVKSASQEQPRSYGYNCCPLQDADGEMLPLFSLADLIFPVRGRPRTVEASTGDVVVIEGDFFANRVDDLRVVLACGAAPLSLKPVSADSLQWVSLSIPGAAVGDCGLTVRDINSRTELTLPISLRIRR